MLKKRSATAMKNDAFDTLYDDEEDEFDRDIKYFKTKVLPDIRKNNGTRENPDWIHFGDVRRPEDIDIFAFWGKHMPHMPIAGPIITEMLGQPAASSLSESTFSYGRYVLGDYRLSTLPERSEKIILSAAKYKSSLVGKSLPKLPTTGEDDDDDDVIHEMDANFETQAINAMQVEEEEGDEVVIDLENETL